MSSSGTLQRTPFKVNVPQADIDDLKRRLQDGVRSKSTYEHKHAEQAELGITTEFLTEAVEQWKSFDWWVLNARMVNAS